MELSHMMIWWLEVCNGDLVTCISLWEGVDLFVSILVNTFSFQKSIIRYICTNHCLLIIDFDFYVYKLNSEQELYENKIDA